MTDPAQIRARLAAALTGEDALEHRPMAEVRAALAALGVDAEQPIRLAEALAAAPSRPAAMLLLRLAEDELNHQLDATEARAAGAGGAADDRATASAATQSAVTGQAAVLPVRPAPQRAFGWRSSLLAIAACLVLWLLARPAGYDLPNGPVPKLAREPATAVGPGANAPAETAGVPADAAPATDPAATTAAAPSAIPTPPVPAEVAPSPAVRAKPAAAANLAAPAPSAPSRLVAEAKRPLTAEEHAPAPAIRPAPSRPSVTAQADAVAEPPVVLPLRDLPAAGAAAGPSDPSTAAIRALLVVEPGLLRLLDPAVARLPAGELADALPTARNVAAGRRVAALVEAVHAGEVLTAVLIQRDPGAPARPRSAATSGLLRRLMLPAELEHFELVPLP